MSEPLSEDQYREEIDRRLDEARPARYHEHESAWMEPVIAWAEANMPPTMRERALRNAIAEYIEGA